MTSAANRGLTIIAVVVLALVLAALFVAFAALELVGGSQARVTHDGFAVTVTATSYTCRKVETDHDPNATASGYRCGDPIIALSSDLLRMAPFGAAVKLAGKWYVVGDHKPGTMTVDVPAKYVKDANAFGRRKIRMEVYLR